MRELRQALLVVIGVALSACVAINDRKGNSREIASINVDLAQQYYTKGNYSVAQQKLDKALAAEPRSFSANSLLALVYSELGKTSAAQEQFETALDLASWKSVEFADVSNNYAIFLCQNGDWPDAEYFFKQALAVDAYQTRAGALENAAFCALNAQDFTKSEFYFQQALKEDKSLSRSLLGLAKVKAHVEDWRSVKSIIAQLHQQAEPVEESLYFAVLAERALNDKTSEQTFVDQLKNLFPNSTYLLKLN